MNVIKSFFSWIMGWVMTGVILVAIGFVIHTFTGENRDSNDTKSSSKMHISKDKKLIEVEKTYWKNGNLKSEVPYKKHYGLGWRKVKTTLIPHGISKDYYENGILKKEDPYIDGKRTGILKLYDTDGLLEATVEYKNSKRNGATTYYNTDGSVLDIQYYVDGNLTTDSV